MNKLPLSLASTAVAVFAAAALAQPTSPLDVRANMQQFVNPAMLAIWDVGNNAMDEEGTLDPAQLDEAKWRAIETQAGALAAVGRDMAAATAFRAASPGNDTVGEGEMTMAIVQGYLDDDPAGFRRFAAEMADHADRLTAAARARDAASTGELIAGMDGVCETCHHHFWYPE